MTRENRYLKKLKFVHRPKCLNGIKELNIECDGRAIICQMGTPGVDALTQSTLRDFDFDLSKFFNSEEVKDKRLNCQSCELNCQQHIYFEPEADNIFKILFKFVTIPLKMFYKIFIKNL